MDDKYHKTETVIIKIFTIIKYARHLQMSLWIFIAAQERMGLALLGNEKTSDLQGEQQLPGPQQLHQLFIIEC